MQSRAKTGGRTGRALAGIACAAAAVALPLVSASPAAAGGVPLAQNDSIRVVSGVSTGPLELLLNDDLGVEPTTILTNTQGANGFTECGTSGGFNPPGVSPPLPWTCIFTADTGSSGADSFTYTLQDSNTATSVGTVNANVLPAPAPGNTLAAVDDSFQVAPDVTTTVNPLTNDDTGAGLAVNLPIAIDSALFLQASAGCQ